MPCGLQRVRPAERIGRQPANRALAAGIRPTLQEQSTRQSRAPGAFGRASHARVMLRITASIGGAVLVRFVALRQVSIPPSTASAAALYCLSFFSRGNGRGCAMIQSCPAMAFEEAVRLRARCRPSFAQRLSRSIRLLRVLRGREILISWGPRQSRSPGDGSILTLLHQRISRPAVCRLQRRRPLFVGQLVRPAEGDGLLAALSRKVAPSKSPVL